jgi:cation diffusion facilitator family transporter
VHFTKYEIRFTKYDIPMTSSATENYSLQKKLLLVTLVLFIMKILAWYYTNSMAILTDAVEYTINVISGFIGLFSLYLSTKPRDYNHPYGHGKAEFLSAAVEGTLMLVSGLMISYSALKNLRYPGIISKLDYGIYLIAFTAAINYLTGMAAIRTGKKNNSLALVASGRHMQTDTYATLGIIVGLIIIYFTGYLWLDSIVSLVFALVIMISGYKIMRTSIAGIMDEADDVLLAQLVETINNSRSINWMDMHNLRIIKYGSILHLDCHFTVPWYFNVNEAHAEIDKLDSIVKTKFGDSVELFVHTDGCMDFSCPICIKEDCPVRRAEFKKKIHWTVENISSNQKHRFQTI